MSTHSISRKWSVSLVGMIGAALIYPTSVLAFNFGDMMNPGKWFGGRDRYYDDYGPYGPYDGPIGPYGYGPGPYGVPYYGPGGYGPYGGYAPGYFGAVPHGVTPPAPSHPSGSTGQVRASQTESSNTRSAEIEALRRRIEELEAKQRQSQPMAPAPERGRSPGDDWSSAPAFRPIGKY